MENKIEVNGTYAHALIFSAAGGAPAPDQVASAGGAGTPDTAEMAAGVPARSAADPGDGYALAQVKMICDLEAARGSRIRVMPDVHPGKIGPVGLTMTITDRVLPGLVGSDIGCGILLAEIRGKKPEFGRLDKVIRERIPSGTAVRCTEHRLAGAFDFSRLRCLPHIRAGAARPALGTLGSGNHFIEMDRDADGTLYAAIHSGSRRLGKEVTEHYMREGQRALKKQGISVPYELTYLEGPLMEDYLSDLQAVQEFAALNRRIMLDEILRGMKWKSGTMVECIHNYVDASADTMAALGAPVLRKGAVSALAGDPVVIPVNMKDGIIVGTGRGCPEWNCSAPHGAGRILKRSDAVKAATLSRFKKEMEGIYSSCICRDTLDEAPFAYRRMDEIVNAIGHTISVSRILRPVFCFKAGSGA